MQIRQHNFVPKLVPKECLQQPDLLLTFCLIGACMQHDDVQLHTQLHKAH